MHKERGKIRLIRRMVSLGSDSLGSGLRFTEEEALDVGEDATSGDGGRSDQLVKLLVVAHSEHDVSWSDGLLLVLSAGIA